MIDASWSKTMTDAHSRALQATRDWLERAVIGLNLCPFAKAVHVNDQIHYAVSSASDGNGLLMDLERELIDLKDSIPEQRDTTLLLAPDAMQEFLDFVELLDRADLMLRRLKLEGVIQIASFHPRFQFSGSGADDIENYTNRSPYPMLHLLREASVERAVAAIADPAVIFDANIARLRAMGHAGWQALGIGGDHAA